MDDLIESYLNGNIGYVRTELAKTQGATAAFLTAFIEVCQPVERDLILAIHRLVTQ